MLFVSLLHFTNLFTEGESWLTNGLVNWAALKKCFKWRRDGLTNLYWGSVPRIRIICWNEVFVWYLRNRAEDWENHSKTSSGKSMGPDSFPVKYSFLCLFSSKHALVDDYRGPILNGFLLLLIKRWSKDTRIRKVLNLLAHVARFLHEANATSQIERWKLFTFIYFFPVWSCHITI